MDIQMNETNIVRVEISEFKDKKNINVRQWYKDKATGEYRPTQKGITLPVEKYQELKEAILALESEVGA